VDAVVNALSHFLKHKFEDHLPKTSAFRVTAGTGSLRPALEIVLHCFCDS
jgi:hypothetical protein